MSTRMTTRSRSSQSEDQATPKAVPLAQDGPQTVKKLPPTNLHKKFDKKNKTTMKTNASDNADKHASIPEKLPEQDSGLEQPGTPTLTSSTPIPTWNDHRRSGDQIGDISDELWSTTPIVSSAGTSLIAAPSPILSMPKKPTSIQLDKIVDDVADHIEHFGTRFKDNEGWMDRIPQENLKFSNGIDLIQTKAVEIKAMNVVARCYELSNKLNTYVNMLQEDAETYMNQREPSTVDLRPPVLQGATNVQQEYEEASTVHESQGVQDSQGNPGTDAGTQQSNENNDISGRVKSIEEKLRLLDLLDRKVKALETSTVSSLVFSDLAKSVNHLEASKADHDVGLAEINATLKSLNEKLTGNTLACRQYEQIASGIVLDKVQLKKQFQTLLSRMDNLQDQVDGASARNSWAMEGPPRMQGTHHTEQQKSSPITGIQVLPTRSSIASTVVSTSSVMHTQTQPVYVQSGTQEQRQSGLAGNVSRGYQYPTGQQIEPATVMRRTTQNERNAQSNRESSPDSSTSSSLVGYEHLSREGRRLKKQSRDLKNMLQPEVSRDIPKATLQDIYKSTVVTVDIERKDLLKALDKYEKSPSADIRLCDEVEDSIEDARAWTAGMRKMHRDLGYHKQSLNNKLYGDLQKFSSYSEVNIFEFLRRFELYTEDIGSPSERAELLYNSYLGEKVQLELVNVRQDYKSMKRKLLKKFGDLTIITDNILRTIPDSMPARSASYLAWTDYFRALNSVMQKIGELRKTADVELDELEDYIYSADFINKLLKFIPDFVKDHFMNQMLDAREDVTVIKGKFAFRKLTSVVSYNFMKYDSLSRSEESYTKKHPKKEKSVSKQRNLYHVAVEDASSSESGSEDDQDEGEVFTHHTQRLQERGMKKHKHPCILDGHDHDVGECGEFFGISPQERRREWRKSKVKICLTCLQDRSRCKDGICSNLKQIPEALICDDCKDVAKQIKKSPWSILFCSKNSHKKPSNKEVVIALEKMLKHFNARQLNKAVNLIGHLKFFGHSSKCSQCVGKCTCKPTTYTSAPKPGERAPAINTVTGEACKPRKDQIIPEIKEDCIFVMQTLRIGGQDCLTMYDRGANQHLISGSLAEKSSLKVVTDEPVVVGIVGGGKIWTEYGSYQMSLGPTAEGKFHQITAQGIRNVTDEFPLHNLRELNDELHKSGKIKPKEKLPKSIGGMRVGLLIGLKDTELEPVCVFQLPSGIGVYKSKLQDKFGSYYCYGGPHKLVTAVNRRTKGNVNHMNAYFIEMVSQYRNSLYPGLTRALSPELVESELGILRVKENMPIYQYKTETGESIYPSALTSQDMNELGKPTKDESNMEDLQCMADHCICTLHNKDPQIHVLKAKIPLQKQKVFIDQDDADNTINFRCSECQKCKCATSNKTKMMSLVEKIEQEAIENSVTVDLVRGKVLVDLPFTKPPVEFLSKRHGKDNNYEQALRVYKTQCRKTESEKQGMRDVHADLVRRGFLKKLCDLPEDLRETIRKSGFKHYMPWRTVMKESTTTPTRMVVDPSMSGLNLILAKGENTLGKINDILIRSRTKKFLWSTDISKLYNQLHLNPASYPYQLFMFKESMDVEDKPEIWVMVVAWYGVTSTGNQSGYALEELAKLLKHKYPSAYSTLINDRYVDDVLSGANTKEEMDKQILDVQKVLEAGGFETKFIVKAGHEPDESATHDKESVKVLGYKWSTEEDFLGPGFQELNFNKKKRGIKKANPFPVASPDDVSKLLSSTKITRRMVVSKMAEIWDPVGLWEPYKLQLKLESQILNGVDWDLPLQPHLQEHWTKRFKEFTEIPSMTAKRCIVPDDAMDPNKIRLLCISDAAVNAGGCAIYGGYKRPNGTYSCMLLTSKSRIMSQSIPRNELEGIRLAASMAYDVKRILGDAVTDVLYFTDSTIAMSWCHNINKKLRLYCLNRVTEIRRLIEGTIGPYENLPLYHIDGKLNIADMLTKPHGITPKDLGENSTWQNGNQWMKLDINDLPITRFSDLSVTKEEEETIENECFPDMTQFQNVDNSYVHTSQKQSDYKIGIVHCPGCQLQCSRIPMDKCYGTNGIYTHCLDCKCRVQFSSFRLEAGKGSTMLVDIIHFGWKKSQRILATCLKFTWMLTHKKHKSRGIESSRICKMCISIKTTNGVQEEIDKILLKEALNYFFKTESRRVKKLVPKKVLETFHQTDGIFYCASRILEERNVEQHDLDYEVFFDNVDIKGILPVVLADSDVFFALVMHIHNNVKRHAGVESTMREVLKTMYVLNNPRRVIQQVRKSCSRCRMIHLKTLELEMGQHPQSRFQIAPAFYHCMADTVFGFKGRPFKNARTRIKVYALVIVCLMTSATSILAMEGLETQDVILAIERHSARHGVPSTIFVDQGTQLMSLENAQFNIRDANAQLHDSLGLKIVPSTAKSHEERGRVERKVRTLREMLSKTAGKAEVSMTAIEWETLFAKMSSEIDDIPIAKGDCSNRYDAGWELLTPNRFKLGRSNNRAIEGPIKLTESSSPTQLLRKVQDIQTYWYQLLLQRLHHLIPRPSKWPKTDPCNVGDICVFLYTENAGMNHGHWKLGKIAEISSNGRRVTISFALQPIPGKVPKLKTIVRCPRDICIISAASEVNLNSKEFFSKISKMN